MEVRASSSAESLLRGSVQHFETQWWLIILFKLTHAFKDFESFMSQGH